MDNDSGRVNMEGELEKKTQQHYSNASYILQPAWLRRAIQTSDGLDRFILDYGYHFLWRFAFVSWLVFIIQKTI